MNHLIEMLRPAGVKQVLDWDTFKTQSFAYYTEIEGSDTVIWVKYRHCISKYTFNITGILIDITTEVPECVQD
jgi:hypothetical protein